MEAFLLDLVPEILNVAFGGQGKAHSKAIDDGKVLRRIISSGNNGPRRTSSPLMRRMIPMRGTLSSPDEASCNMHECRIHGYQ